MEITMTEVPSTDDAEDVADAIAGQPLVPEGARPNSDRREQGEEGAPHPASPRAGEGR